MSSDDLRWYRKVHAPDHPVADVNGWAYEHRVVAYDTYGPIPSGHDVHHINGDGLDNRPENLEIIDHGEHRREHLLKVSDADVYAEHLKGLSTLEIAERVGGDPANVWRQIKRIREA